MYRKLLLSAVGVLAIHSAAHAGLVKVAGSASSGNEMYVDSGFKYVNNNRNLLRVQLVSRYSKDLPDGRKKGSSTAMEGVLDCKEKTIAVEKFITFSATGATEIEVAYPANRITKDKLSEGTLMWTMQDIVCASARGE